MATLRPIVFSLLQNPPPFPLLQILVTTTWRFSLITAVKNLVLVVVSEATHKLDEVATQLAMAVDKLGGVVTTGTHEQTIHVVMDTLKMATQVVVGMNRQVTLVVMGMVKQATQVAGGMHKVVVQVFVVNLMQPTPVSVAMVKLVSQVVVVVVKLVSQSFVPELAVVKFVTKLLAAASKVAEVMVKLVTNLVYKNVLSTNLKVILNTSKTILHKNLLLGKFIVMALPRVLLLQVKANLGIFIDRYI